MSFYLGLHLGPINHHPLGLTIRLIKTKLIFESHYPLRLTVQLIKTKLISKNLRFLEANHYLLPLHFIISYKQNAII